MLGMADVWVALAYAGCLLSALLCVVYGLLMWNRNPDADATPQDPGWLRDEDEMRDNM
ncbi:MAG: hypothetical protein GX580_06840 [Candidatus Hydrogenedens sp.]|nr:hypothetical protein [Candidatus Hydrogenedens sp.]